MHVILYDIRNSDHKKIALGYASAFINKNADALHHWHPLRWEKGII